MCFLIFLSCLKNFWKAFHTLHLSCTCPCHQLEAMPAHKNELIQSDVHHLPIRFNCSLSEGARTLRWSTLTQRGFWRLDRVPLETADWLYFFVKMKKESFSVFPPPATVKSTKVYLLLLFKLSLLVQWKMAADSQQCFLDLFLISVDSDFFVGKMKT